MSMNDLDYRVRNVFREIFDNDEMEIWDAMAAKDVAGWDSLTQVKLIIALEEEFDIKVTIHDVAHMSCVGDLKQILLTKK